MTATPTVFITPEALLAHWQGHRRLTRRVIDAFPDAQLFTFSVGGMRPFGALALGMLSMVENPARAIHETMTAFGQYTGIVHDLVLHIRQPA